MVKVGGSVQDVINSRKQAADKLEAATSCNASDCSSLFGTGEVGIQEEKLVANIAFDMLNAISFMHSHSLLHLDVKPSNVLLNSKGDAKLADFGLAKKLEEANNFAGKTFNGTFDYMSPERLRREQYSYPSDIWSFAWTVVAILLGESPSTILRENSVSGSGSGQTGVSSENTTENEKQDSTTSQFLFGDRDQQCVKKVLEQHRFSEILIDMVLPCLQVDPSKRPTAKQLLKHKFFRNHNLQVGRKDKPLAGKKHSKRANKAWKDEEASRLLLTQVSKRLAQYQTSHKGFEVQTAKVKMLAKQLNVQAQVVQLHLSAALKEQAIKKNLPAFKLAARQFTGETDKGRRNSFSSFSSLKTESSALNV